MHLLLCVVVDDFASDAFRPYIIVKIVYARLLYRSNRDGVLSFHVLAMLALNSDGTLKQEKIKKLIQIFRPQRDGSLSALDFGKCYYQYVNVFLNS